MSTAPSDAHATDRSSLPMFTLEARRMPRAKLPVRVIGVLESRDRPVPTSDTASSFRRWA
jgi:hypothetical protein